MLARALATALTGAREPDRQPASASTIRVSKTLKTSSRERDVTSVVFQNVKESLTFCTSGAEQLLNCIYVWCDFGRYSPTFAAAQSSVLPYNKSSSVASVIPVGSGPLGLPVGGANFDGLARTCTTNITGRPPRPQASKTVAPGQQGSYSRGNNNGMRVESPIRAHSPAYHPNDDPEPQVQQNADGEWAF